MTDIRRHLPVIISCIRQRFSALDVFAKTEVPLDEALIADVKSDLAALLPASYGITSGHLVNAQLQQSQALQIIIYDKTIPSSLEAQAERNCDLRQALLFIMVADELDIAGLNNVLQTIASAKALLPKPAYKQKSQPPTPLPLKKLLPLGLVAFRQMSSFSDSQRENLSQTLNNALKQQNEDLRPDFLIAQNHGISYSNPHLDGQPFTPTTINIALEPELRKQRICYMCKRRFKRQHFFYERLCLSCGDFNYHKRQIAADLTGRVALVTGARVKIGYATALRLLRAGAQVIVTTRFPHDAARRYASEPDFGEWGHRLEIYGLDFRQLEFVQRFIDHLGSTYPALDILINNAAQTIRRPASYYAGLLSCEQQLPTALPEAQQRLLAHSHALLPVTPFVRSVTTPAQLPGVSEEDTSIFSHVSQEAGLQVLPGQNSWTKRVDEIDLTELLEVQVINVTVPYLLVSRLRPLLSRSSFAMRFIVNVSALEGQFVGAKQGMHPHTNMAKAALNMLTHTSAADLAQDNIFMNSVDPGWISQQYPSTDLRSWEEQQEAVPLDLDDAAARICDPIFSSLLTGQLVSGQLLKDFLPAKW